MKKRIIIWTLVAVVVLWVLKAVFPICGIHLALVPLLVGLVPLVFWASLAAVHIAIAISVWRDAKQRPDLLFGIPPWTWGLMGLATGAVGLIVHWLANCCQFVKNQTQRFSF